MSGNGSGLGVELNACGGTVHALRSCLDSAKGFVEHHTCLFFFTRPGNSMILRPLSDESSIIAEAVSKLPEDKYNTGSTSLDWFTRRIKNQRVKNRMGPETWRASRGTEHRPSAT